MRSAFPRAGRSRTRKGADPRTRRPAASLRDAEEERRKGENKRIVEMRAKRAASGSSALRARRGWRRLRIGSAHLRLKVCVVPGALPGRTSPVRVQLRNEHGVAAERKRPRREVRRARRARCMRGLGCVRSGPHNSAAGVQEGALDARKARGSSRAAAHARHVPDASGRASGAARGVNEATASCARRRCTVFRQAQSRHEFSPVQSRGGDAPQWHRGCERRRARLDAHAARRQQKVRLGPRAEQNWRRLRDYRLGQRRRRVLDRDVAEDETVIKRAAASAVAVSAVEREGKRLVDAGPTAAPTTPTTFPAAAAAACAAVVALFQRHGAGTSASHSASSSAHSGRIAQQKTADTLPSKRLDAHARLGLRSTLCRLRARQRRRGHDRL